MKDKTKSMQNMIFEYCLAMLKDEDKVGFLDKKYLGRPTIKSKVFYEKINFFGQKSMQRNFLWKKILYEIEKILYNNLCHKTILEVLTTLKLHLEI